MSNPRGVDRVVTAAGGKQQLADEWGISYQAVDKFVKRGHFPLDRAKQAAASYDVALSDLVAPDIREAMLNS